MSGGIHNFQKISKFMFVFFRFIFFKISYFYENIFAIKKTYGVSVIDDILLCRRAGAGEYGEAVELDASLNGQVKDVIGEFGFNLIASDRISLDRAPKDLRHQE